MIDSGDKAARKSGLNLDWRAINPPPTADSENAATATLAAADKSRAEKILTIKKLEQEIFDKMVDVKTSTFSHKYLERFIQTLKESGEELHDLGIIFVDVNDLKTVNDTKGHAAGDRLLENVASKLSQVATINPQQFLEQSFRISRGDFVVRRAGDEFIVVCINDKNDQNFGTGLEKKMTELQKKAQEEGVSFAYGLSTCLKDKIAEQIEQTIETADLKMQVQKDKQKGLLHRLMRQLIRALTGKSR